MTRVLVAYASKYGATAEIAARIGATLREAGLAVDVQEVASAPAVDGYDVVLLGSAVYAGQWMRSASEFLRQHVEALAAKPVWFFSSGPTGDGDPAELMKGWTFPQTLEPEKEQVGPRGVAFFHGSIDMNKVHFGERMIVKALRAPTGDYRNWGMINDWVQEVVAALQ